MNPTLEQSFDILFEISHLKTCHKVNGLLPTLQTASSLVRICGHKLCRTCNHLNCSPVFSRKITKQTFPIRHKATCTSSYLIYLITCTKCGKQYVGMTRKQLHKSIITAGIYCKIKLQASLCTLISPITTFRCKL